MKRCIYIGLAIVHLLWGMAVRCQGIRFFDDKRLTIADSSCATATDLSACGHAQAGSPNLFNSEEVSTGTEILPFLTLSEEEEKKDDKKKWIIWGLIAAAVAGLALLLLSGGEEEEGQEQNPLSEPPPEPGD